MKSFIKAVGYVFGKELLSEIRSRELLAVMLVFALLVVFIFNFALDMQSSSSVNIISGVLWVTYTFAGTLGMNRSMGSEKDNDCLDGLLLLPIDRTVIFFGKMLANLVFMLILAVIMLPLYAVFFNQNLWSPGLFLTILLGSYGFVTIGTLLASLTASVRTREMLLPVILFPVVLPLLIAAVKASSAYLMVDVPDDVIVWRNLLLAYDLVFTAAAVMVYDYILEE